MNAKSYLIVIICSFVVHLANFTQKGYYVSLGSNSSRISITFAQGLIFFTYPSLGHIADACFSRHRTIKASFVVLFVSGLLALVVTVINILVTLICDKEPDKNFYGVFAVLIIVCILLINIVGVGLFKANAIQFGLDQLLEDPTPKLITFIHWYYWSQSFAETLGFYAYIGYMQASRCPTALRPDIITSIGYIIYFVLVAGCAIIIMTLFYAVKKSFYIQKAGLNPFKNIYKVLKYSWKHKVPEHRSAFTYWEEDIPRRIDLGKTKYGGPFTNEEVEDTKTFLRILPLLLCLFGYHLAGDGYSAPTQLQRNSCPSLPVLLLIVLNPLHISTLVVVVAIPLYRLIIKKFFSKLIKTLMLTRLWIGLYLSLLQIVFNIIFIINHNNDNELSWITKTNHTHLSISYWGPTSVCYSIRTGIYHSKNVNHPPCLTFSQPVDNTYLWFIIPQLLNGLSSLLVSMTVFEFICAQAPRTTQGLLIGLWYATFSIRYLVVGTLDNVITEKRSWLIYEGVKGFLILVSLVLFSCVSRRYRYRQRDEIVNVQRMIEDTHERWLDQEEEYMQERKALLSSLKTGTVSI